MRFIFRLIVICIFGYGAYAAYDFHRAGYFSLPDLPEGAYTASFKSGLRAIILDAEVTDTSYADRPKYFRSLALANPERKYLGIALEVQPWFKDAWSWCRSPTEEDRESLAQTPADFRRNIENARLDAVCTINVDGTEIPRGLIFSVPKL